MNENISELYDVILKRKIDKEEGSYTIYIF